MNDDFDFAFEAVIGHEGGFTKRRTDPGNWTGGRIGAGRLLGTKYGISAASYPRLDIPNLSLDDAKMIYREDYWNASGANICPRGISYAVFDAGVNAGNLRARKWLQIAVGAYPDGIIGPKTRRAAEDRMLRDPLGVLEEFQSQRTWHHMKLDSMDDEYGLGWSRRIISVTVGAYKRFRG